jgi:Mg2+ and Co2+ transporter CorA
MALEARMTPVRTVSEGHPPRKFTQSASLLYLNYGKNLDQDLLASNPFYALTDLLKFTAFSEVQFLNMMETKLMKETNFSVINPRHSPTLSNLLYSKNLLDQHVQHIDGTISFIKTHLESKSDDDTSDMVEEASAAATSLLEDFEYLSNRAKALSLHCDRGMNIVMNNNMLLESQRAMEQAAGVAKLTRLAFFYIPLSFTASFFGMNFKQLGTGVLSIWVWFAASLPVFLISILFLAVDIMWYLRALWSSIKSIFSKKRV